ncbi:hypothetical protein F4X86_03975 [Candidatus Saccharibacteria bacterium]|nr:hypothetical protein [Candidatus Saccharibacteria bacterium]
MPEAGENTTELIWIVSPLVLVGILVLRELFSLRERVTRVEGKVEKVGDAVEKSEDYTTKLAEIATAAVQRRGSEQ